MTSPAASAVRKALTVDVPVEHAFDVFTRRMDAWWPRTHHIGGSPMKEAVLEPFDGGRWYERGDDGSECEWGRVLVWERPSRLVLAWQTNGAWQHDPDPAHASEVDVRFVAESPQRTRVELEHRHLDRHTVGGEALRIAVDSPGGWTAILASYKRVAEAGPAASD
jgi:uncharacterized protein YndB with AHSA1/START domain